MRHDPRSLMVFSAGFGTRMHPLTVTRPKPLIPVAGRALIDHTLDLARAAGIDTIVANTHYLPEQLAAHLAPHRVTISPEPNDILDTGGGLKAARPVLGPGPCFTLNPDAIWRGPNPLAQLRDAWHPQTMGALLLLVPPLRAHAHKGRGDFLLGTKGRLTRGPGAIYTGAQIIDPAVLDRIEARVFSLNQAWDLLAIDGRLFGLMYPGHWCDVGHPPAIATAEALLANEPDV